MLIGDLLRDSARRAPDKPALLAHGRSLTYAAMDRAADRVANAMLDRGIGPGACAAMLSANSIDYPTVYFGAARSGALMAHLSTRSTVDDLVHMLGRIGARMVFAGPAALAEVRAARRRLPALDLVVVLGGGADADADADAGEMTLDAFLEGAGEGAPDIAPDPEAPYCITFTGGTTGTPKAVLATHRNRAWSAKAAIKAFDLAADDVMLCTTPMFHVAGLCSWMQTGVALGCTLDILEHWDVESFIAAVEGGVTAAFMVPTQIVALLNHPGAVQRLGNMRYVNYGGSPISPVILARAMDALPHVLWEEHYGQSEGGPIAIRPPDFNATKAASVGHTLEGQELAALDAHGEPLPPGEVGEIATRGPNVFFGYLGDPEQTAAVKLANGWLRTGDVGYLDEDGFIFLVDRAKDMMICGGENVYPAEVENALYQHPAVKECAVFGIPDETWGEVPAAHVIFKDGQSASAEELIDFAAGRIPRHKRPRLIEFVDDLPKTAVGKIQKNVIRAPYWQGRERAI